MKDKNSFLPKINNEKLREKEKLLGLQHNVENGTIMLQELTKKQIEELKKLYKEQILKLKIKKNKG